MADNRPNVLMVAHSEYRGFYMPLVERLVGEFGAAVHLFVGTEQQVDYYRAHYGAILATINVSGALYKACREPVMDAAAVRGQATRNELFLGVTINQLNQSDRHLGRGFSLGGFRHPRSRISEETSYLQMLAGTNEVIDFWRQAIERLRPDLIISPGKILSVLARHYSIPARHIANSRHKNYYYWAHNELFETPAFEEAFATSEGNKQSELNGANAAHLANRSQMRGDATIARVAKAMGLAVLRHGYWRLKGYEKAKGYYLQENLAYMWRSYRDIRMLTDNRFASLEELRREPYVFFPLATEPETSLQMISPEYTYQLSAIASVARDLPAGIILAVKEHYAAVGRRPADFYDQIAEFKNVKLVNMEVLGVEASRTAKAVVTISGSAGFEAAAMGVPVVAFGLHNIYNFLPHVFVVRSETDLAGYLDAICRDKVDLAKAGIDGRRFVAAIVARSFDARDYIPGRAKLVSEQALNDSLRALLASAPGVLGDRTTEIRPTKSTLQETHAS